MSTPRNTILGRYGISDEIPSCNRGRVSDPLHLAPSSLFFANRLVQRFAIVCGVNFSRSEFIACIEELSVIRDAHCLEEFTNRIPHVMIHQGVADCEQRNSSRPSTPSDCRRECTSRSCSCSSSESSDTSATSSHNSSPVYPPETTEVQLPGVFAFGHDAEPSASLLNSVSDTVPATAFTVANEEDAGPGGSTQTEAEKEDHLPAEVWVPAVDLDEPSPSPSVPLSDAQFQDARSTSPTSFYSPIDNSSATSSAGGLCTCQNTPQHTTSQALTTEEEEFEDAVIIVRQEDEDACTIVEMNQLSDTNYSDCSDADVSIVAAILPNEKMVSTSASTSLSSHISNSNKENAPPSHQNAILSEEPQKCRVPASPPKSSTDYVDSRNPSTATGVLDSTLWPSKRKLRNDSPLGDIYSPLHALRVLRSRPVKTARPTQRSSTHSLTTVSQASDRCKYRWLSHKAKAISAETTNRGETAYKQCTCQPSNLPWNIQTGSLNAFTNPSKGEFIHFVLKSVHDVEELRRISPEACLSDEWLNMLTR
ncbi:hypothetical protein AAHC03_013702 [Spirometra sp. Aus1]